MNNLPLNACSLRVIISSVGVMTRPTFSVVP